MRQIERRAFGECQPLGNYKSERPIGALITARRTREEETRILVCARWTATVEDSEEPIPRAEVPQKITLAPNCTCRDGVAVEFNSPAVPGDT
jgi:hypothetical protein